VRTVLFQCASCGAQTSVLAGTVFQDTRQPLRQWFRAMWCVTSAKTGTSALNLQQVLGLGSYKTAWSWLHKLRRAMVRPDRERLHGRVEVDETFLGAPIVRRLGTARSNKVVIGVAVEEDENGVGRVRMRRLADASTASLRPFVDDVVERGSIVHTDGWMGYDFLERRGYRHEISFLRGHTASPSELLPRVHRVVSLLKRWLLGTHQGSITAEHLDYYLDEFTFRFNRRRSRSRGKLFYRLAQQAVATRPAPYRSLVRIAVAPNRKM
jgi:transposase-like protein